MVLVIGSPWKFIFSPFPQANRKQMITKLTKESGFLWLKSQNLFPISIRSRTAKLEKTSFLIKKQFLINVSERTMGTFGLEAESNIWKQEMRPEGRKLKEESGIWGSFESFMTMVIKSFLSQKKNVKRWVAVIFLNWKNFNVYPQKTTKGKKAKQYREDVTGTYSFNWASERPKQIGAQWLGIHFCHRGAESLLQGSRVIVIHRETWVHRHTGAQWVRIQGPNRATSSRAGNPGPQAPYLYRSSGSFQGQISPTSSSPSSPLWEEQFQCRDREIVCVPLGLTSCPESSCLSVWPGLVFPTGADGGFNRDSNWS